MLAPGDRAGLRGRLGGKTAFYAFCVPRRPGKRPFCAKRLPPRQLEGLGGAILGRGGKTRVEGHPGVGLELRCRRNIIRHCPAGRDTIIAAWPLRDIRASVILSTGIFIEGSFRWYTATYPTGSKCAIIRIGSKARDRFKARASVEHKPIAHLY